jgi:hypothetical protein
MKTCYRCKIDKELNEFNKDSKKKDGLNLYCKGCLKEMKAEKKITEEILEKKCKYCLETKMITDFNVDKSKRDNYNLYCKKCVKEKNEKSISKNKVENIIEKKCSKCNNIKHIKDYHISKKSKDGYYTYCKLCTINYKYDKRKIEEKKECVKCKEEKGVGFFVEDINICQVCLYLEKLERKKFSEENVMKKICVRCKKIKDKADFNKNNTTKDKLCPTCKDCLKLYFKKYKDYMIYYRIKNKNILKLKQFYYRINNKDKIANLKKNGILKILIK